MAKLYDGEVEFYCQIKCPDKFKQKKKWAAMIRLHIIIYDGVILTTERVFYMVHH